MPKKKELKKLFVWVNFCPDYTGGLAFAIAEDVPQAMALIEEQRGYGVSDWGDLSIYPVDQEISFSVSGGG